MRLPLIVSRIPRRERTAMVVFAVGLCVVCCAWLFGMALRASIWGVEEQFLIRTGLRSLFPGRVEALTEVGLIITAAVVGYGMVLWALRRGFRGSFSAAIAGTILAVLSILPLAPSGSPDALHLAADVRTLWLHGKYPAVMENAPSNIDDPVAQKVDIFEESPSGYGPAAYAIGGLALPFVGDNLRANIAGQKAIAGIFLVATAVATGFAARRFGRDPALAAGVIGMHPLMLFSFPGDGHNDIIMVAFAVAALPFLAAPGWRARAGGAGFALLSVLSKFSVAAAGPVVLASWFPRWRRLIAAVTVVLGAAAVWYVVFGSPNVAAAGPATEVVRTTPWGVIAYYAEANDVAKERMVGVALLLFVALAAAIVWLHRLDKPGELAAAVGLTLWALVFACLPGMLPWYQAWYLPFAVLSGKRWFMATALVFSVGAFLPTLAINWAIDIRLDMGIGDPVEKAVIFLWVATAATALTFLYLDNERRRRPTPQVSKRRRVQRKPIRA